MLAKKLIDTCIMAIARKENAIYRPADMARDMGVSRAQLSGIKDRFAFQTAEKISSALSKHGIEASPNHIFEGLTQEDWQLMPELDHPVGIPYINGKNLNGEPVKIPYYRISAAAGGGVFAEGKTDAVQIYFLSGWIRDRLNTTPKNLFAMDIYGDSMEPTLRHGDTVLVDKKKNHLRSNGLYVLEINDMLIVKRVEVQPDNSILMKSDNPDYEPYVLKPGEEGHFGVKGRVVKLIGRDIL